MLHDDALDLTVEAFPKLREDVLDEDVGEHRSTALENRGDNLHDGRKLSDPRGPCKSFPTQSSA